MRVSNEPVAVRLSSDAAPTQFVWRRRLWRVLAVQRSWVEAVPWWDDPRVRSVARVVGFEGAGRHAVAGPRGKRQSEERAGRRTSIFAPTRITMRSSPTSTGPEYFASVGGSRSCSVAMGSAMCE